MHDFSTGGSAHGAAKRLLCGVLTVLTGLTTAWAETYWLGAASSGATPPKCFKFYTDEALSQQVTITPKANDGNTYVVLGSSKMTGSYTAPVGTKWIFGTDGTTVGTATNRPAFGTNGSDVTLDFSGGDVCTIYGAKIQVNSDGYLIWNGTNRLVKTSQDIDFHPMNITSSKPRGAKLAGTFLSDTHVCVLLNRDAASSTQAGSLSPFILSGDFSAYKGRWRGQNTGVLGHSRITLSSSSAFGDPSVTNTAYITLQGWTDLEIQSGVTQYGTKGILCDNSKYKTATNCLYAADDAQITLTAPVRVSYGTLAKTGSGRIDLASSISFNQSGYKKLVVQEGTLTITKNATFTEETVLVICSGAQVVSQLGINIPNVTIEREEGGLFSFDFTAPFDGTTVTTLDMTTLTADEWTALDKPVPVQLSQAIPVPFASTNRYAVAKFPTALGITAAQFSDATAKTYGLPITWIEVVHGDDCDRVEIVARPAVSFNLTRTAMGHGPCLDPATQTDNNGAEHVTWSDGRAVHAGADYYNTNNTDFCTSLNWEGTGSVYRFGGESLTLVHGTLNLKHHYVRFARLVEYDQTSNSAFGYATGDCAHHMEGNLEVPSGTVSFNATTDTNRRVIDLAMRVTGSAVLAFTGSDTRGFAPSFTGDGSAFAGTLAIRVTGTTDVPSRFAFTNIATLVANRTSSDPRAIYMDATGGSWAMLQPLQDTILENVNYGVAFGAWGNGFDIPTNVTLTLDTTLRFQQLYAQLRGGGTLALGGNVTYGYDGNSDPGNSAYFLHLFNGWVKPYAWNTGLSYKNLRVEIDAPNGAGFAIPFETEDASIAAYGMFLNKTNAVTFASNATILPIRILPPASADDLLHVNTIPLLTVRNALAETLADKIKVQKTLSHVRVTLTSAPATGDYTSTHTTFWARTEPIGFTLIIR